MTRDQARSAPAGGANQGKTGGAAAFRGPSARMTRDQGRRARETGGAPATPANRAAARNRDTRGTANCSFCLVADALFRRVQPASHEWEESVTR